VFAAHPDLSVRATRRRRWRGGILQVTKAAADRRAPIRPPVVTQQKSLPEGRLNMAGLTRLELATFGVTGR